MSPVSRDIVDAYLETASEQTARLRELCGPADIRIDDSAFPLFERYIRLLIRTSGTMNLLSRNDLGRIAERHIFESLLLSQLYDFSSSAALLDFGAGGGFPAIPLKIAFPHLRTVMVEATGKKYRFLEESVKKLGLTEISVINGRIESLANEDIPYRPFDVVTARAVAPLNVLLRYARPFVKHEDGGGICLFPKGSRAESEMRDCRDPGWTIKAHDLTTLLPDFGESSSLYIISALLTTT